MDQFYGEDPAFERRWPAAPGTFRCNVSTEDHSYRKLSMGFNCAALREG